VELAREGEERALEILQTIGERLGSAIGSIVNTFNPELVVVGGGFSAAGELILGPARDRMRREALPGLPDLTKVVLAELGSDAGLIGAGFVGFEALES
jgi:glucokinase